MAFSLPHVLKALLFSSGQPLTVRAIQAAFTRFHEQVETVERVEGMPPLLTEEIGSTEEVAVDDGGEALAEVPTLVTAAQIREAMEGIAAELRAADEVFRLVEGAVGYRLVTHPRYARWVRVLRNEPAPARLSQSALETLAIIAYRQPVTRGEIETIRGVSADAGLNKLLERELVYVPGRADLPGRPL